MRADRKWLKYSITFDTLASQLFLNSTVCKNCQRTFLILKRLIEIKNALTPNHHQLPLPIHRQSRNCINSIIPKIANFEPFRIFFRVIFIQFIAAPHQNRPVSQNTKILAAFQGWCDNPRTQRFIIHFFDIPSRFGGFVDIRQIARRRGLKTAPNIRRQILNRTIAHVTNRQVSRVANDE